MQKKVYPIIVTTLEALQEVVKEDCYVIYIDERLYNRYETSIQNKLCSHGYIMAQECGKHGFFFLQTRGDHLFNPNLHFIYDPYKIL